MPSYYVTFPIVGTATVLVEAENKEEAIKVAAESPDLNKESIEDWDILTRGCRGNVCYLPSHHVHVSECD